MGFKNKRTGRSLTFDMNQLVRDVTKVVKKEALDEAEEILQELAHKSFEKEKFVDGTAQKKWKGRENENPKLDRKKRRALLVKSGEGRRSVDTFQQGNKVGVGTDVKYMEVHSRGLRAGKGKGFRMTKRQIITEPGQENKALTRRMTKFLDKRFDQINK